MVRSNWHRPVIWYCVWFPGLGIDLVNWNDLHLSYCYSSIKKEAKYLIISGKVVNSHTTEWPNDRLVLLYQHNSEIARATTHIGESHQNKLGIIDGIFELQIENTYRFSVNQLEQEDLSYEIVPSHRWIKWWNRSIIYIWLGDTEEGGDIEIYIPSKNVQ